MNLKQMTVAAAISALAVGQSLAKDYSGAELYTKEIFHYGKFEARMQMASGNGLVSSMFLYHNDSYMGGGEPWVEVDIEILGKSPGSFQSNIISGTAEAKVTSEEHHNLNPAADQGYHTYGLEWTPDYISWQIDGQEVRRTKKGDAKNQVEAMIKDQGLRFNLWSSEEAAWVGAWNDGILPRHQYINWVKVYDYTPGQGDNGTDFKLKWVDDFEKLDRKRWAMGDWTFDGNRVDMSPDNVTVKDGTLILSITKSGQEGFDGQVPVDPQNSTPETPKDTVSKDTTVTKPDTSVTKPDTSAGNPDTSTNIISISESAAPFRFDIQNKAVLLNVPKAGFIKLEIVNAKGKVQMKTSKNYDIGSYLISLESLPSGQYFMNIQQNGKTKSVKFVKQ
ncbi:MAG: family 16 glycosylhydrolase [Fibrobacter sp.]|nr:family 16 glycosylhydrolase [Fibrobacter sp.]